MGDFEDLIALANEYGSKPEWVRAGGGNASLKADGLLHIKPSGVPLATLAADDLVPLRLDVLLEALRNDEPVEGDPVRAAAERARVGAPARRPSVEILFHALIGDTFVLHTHPLAANALTCNERAEALAAELLGDEAVYVPYTDPGVPLARAVDERRRAFEARTGSPAPGVTLLGNHGVIVSGNTADEVRQRSRRLESAVEAALAAAGLPIAGFGASGVVSGPDEGIGSGVGGQAVGDPAVPGEVGAADGSHGLDALVGFLAPTLRGLLAVGGVLPVVASDASEFVRQATLTPGGQAVLRDGPLIPDQIVYAGSLPLVVDADAVAPALEKGAAFDAAAEKPALDAVSAALADYAAAHGHPPIVVAVPGAAVFAAGPDLKAARNALATFTDALRVANDAERLGRARVMTAGQRDFIEHWEAESYRKAVAAQERSGRLDGKVVVVTGAAQGFGLGLAAELLGDGASVVLADLNIDLARRNAEALSRQHGEGRAVAVAVDVADEGSVLDCAAEVVSLFGGLDVFVSNAGVARAGAVFSQPVADFDFVTQVNYRGYLLGVKAVAPVMARQHEASPQSWFDIVEVNSKSGLEGSKRNFAYAGSKFGGIGLTQSFALELVENGVKVNAVCPGNYLDGPLWSDPERGLFVQYLRAGKVPGARTVDDVRAYYESKVPIGRGCQPHDLALAVRYLVEQQYETGQALPVTGGQNMLN